jgi:hypothetical protein
MTNLHEADGEKLGKLTIDLKDDQPREDLLEYKVESQGELETEFDLPRYHTFLGWIEIFGLPPCNEWVLLEDFKQLEKEFEGEIKGEKYSESLKIEDKGPIGTWIELKRESGKMEEEHQAIELEYSETSTSGSMALFNIDHSKGEYSARINRQIAENSEEVDKIKERLDKEEGKYLEARLEEEGNPSLVVFKKAEVYGSAPPVYQKMFPFWNKKEFNNSEIRILEVGYMDKGDSEEDIDNLHGRWYKLFSFEDFDHNQLEIREGNWQSTEIHFQGEKTHTKDHYEKHLYKYND